MRRTSVAIALALLVPQAPAGAQTCDWPMYGRDPGHSFASDCSTITAPVALVPKWFVPAADSVTASAAVVDGTVFIGSWDGTFRAIDASDGTLRWTFAVDDTHDVAFGRIVSSAAVTGDAVIFGGGGTLYAVHRGDGRELARVTIDPHPASEIESSPTVVGDTVYVGMDVHNAQGATRTGMFAFRFTGSAFESLWHFDPEAVLPEPAGCGGVWSSPAVDAADGIVFFGTANCEQPATGMSESVYAVDASTGGLRWTFAPRGPNRLDDDFGASPNLLPDRMVGFGGKDGRYYAHSRRTGAEAWTSQPGQPGHVNDDLAIGGIIGTPAVADGRIYITTALSIPDESVRPDPQRMFSLHAIETTYGDIVWRTPLSRQSYGAPTYANGIVYVPSTFDLSLKAFDAANGLPLFSVPLPGAPSSAPVLAGDSVYIGVGTRTTDGEYEQFGAGAVAPILGAHPLSPLSGIAAFRQVVP